MTRPRTPATAGPIVAAGMVGMNVAIYAFNLVAARQMLPREFGAVTALFGILLVGTVAGLGLQAVTARRLAVDPARTERIIAETTRVTLLVSCVVGSVVAVSTVVLTPVLRLGSHLPVVLAGATLVPLTVMGAQSGVAQGAGRWGRLTAIYVANGIGRLAGGTIAMIVSPTPTSAMVGLAVGALLPVLVGRSLLSVHSAMDRPPSRRPVLREAFLATHALLAYLVLSNLDAWVARNRLDLHESGLYASGLILSKAALFLPQFVSVVLYPELARATDGATRARAVRLVLALSTLAVVATAVLPRLALVMVGGQQYEEVAERLWLFTLAGAAMAIVHLLVLDALARHVHGVVVMLWVAVGVVLAIALTVDLDITGLVVTMTVISAALATVVWRAARISTPAAVTTSD